MLDWYVTLLNLFQRPFPFISSFYTKIFKSQVITLGRKEKKNAIYTTIEILN